jgi:hypothetical protein
MRNLTQDDLSQNSLLDFDVLHDFDPLSHLEELIQQFVSLFQSEDQYRVETSSPFYRSTRCTTHLALISLVILHPDPASCCLISPARRDFLPIQSTIGIPTNTQMAG